jgi:antitoxin (DNA-binding transcriptional repressor) of toxin-antitoxin stability system
MPVKIIDIADAQNQLAELIAQAATGVEIILTAQQIPQARLLPISSASTQRVPGLHQGNITISSDFDSPLPDPFWMGEL